MNDKYSMSHEMYAKAVKLIPGGVNSPVRAFKSVGGKPIYFKKAQGSRFTDVDGNEFVDFCQSWGPLILGHADEKVVEAVREAAFAGLSYGACHAGEIELAELVLQSMPEFERVRFVSSGTEAVMTALRLARGATGRSYVLKFEGGYHGHSDGLLVRSGSGLATLSIASSAGVPDEIARTTLIAPFDDEEAVREIFKRYGNNIAAVIIEPLPANNGLLEQRIEYLRFLRDISYRNGSLLIFDEVISGFRFRFGTYGSMIGIEPDMVTLGKIIGGGLPVGAIVGRAIYLDRLAPVGSVYQAGTLSGNPLSLAAGIATLKSLRDNPPYQYMEDLGMAFDGAVKEAMPQYAGSIKRVGSLIWLYPGDKPAPRRASLIEEAAVKRFNGIYWKLLDSGFYLPPSAYEVLFLSKAHSREEVVALVKAVEAALKEKNGF